MLLLAVLLWVAHPVMHHHDHEHEHGHGHTHTHTPKAEVQVECSLCLTGTVLDPDLPVVSELIPAPEIAAAPTIEFTQNDYKTPLLAISPTRGPPAQSL